MLLIMIQPCNPASVTVQAPISPTESCSAAAPDADYPFYVAQEEDIKKALASFRPGSASGPDGLRPGHLQTLISGKAIEAGVRLLASLTRFVNLMLRGEVPEFAQAIIYGVGMFALSKKDRGICLIAVGNTLRR